MTIFYVLLAFISGVLLLKFPFSLLGLILLLYKNHNKRPVLLFLMSAFIGGFLLVFIPTLLAYTPFLAQYALIIKTSSNSFLVWSVQGRFFIEKSAHHYQVGDIVKISGARMKIFFGGVEGGFDYGAYLQSQGVFSALKVSEISVVIPSLLRLFSNNVILQVQYPTHLASLQKLLLVRELDYKDPFLQKLQHDDLIFLISMTGAHLSFIRRVNKKVLATFSSDKHSEIISYALLLPLFFLNVTKFAFYRLFGSGLYTYINKYKLNSYFSRLEVNSLLALTFLIINPFLLFNVAFYLAFIFIFLFTFVRPAKSVRGVLFSVLLVWLVIVPYKVFASGIVNVSSLVLPFIMTPLVSIWFITYFLTLPFSVLHNSPMTMLNVIYRVLNFAQKYSVTFYFKSYHPLLVIISLLFLFIFLYATLLKMRILQKNLGLCFVTLFIISFIPVQRLLTYRLTFINVGQGDSILLETRKANILVDTGGLYNRDIATEVLIPFFYRQNIYKIHYLIITHDDFDHNGGVESLVENFNVNNIITTKDVFPLNVCGLMLYNLNPYDYGDDNLNSLILYFSLPSFDVLLMGDAGVINEAQIIDDYPTLNVDILKVGHHGSNTSTSAEFISHYLPKVAIISCGYNNRYGHPHADVIKVLNKYNVKIRRTDLEGTITLKSSII